jgi:Tfp pilus assembly protein PilZ
VKDPDNTSDQSGVKARLKDLIKEISSYIDSAPEDQQQRFLRVLEDLRQSDRRKHPRKPCAITITYMVEDRTFTDLVTNICPGGVFIKTSQAFSVGQQMTIGFSCPEQGQSIKCQGKIVWDSPNGIGVKFTSATPNLQEVIKSL